MNLFLPLIAVFFLDVVSSGQASLLLNVNPHCRCIYGQSCWPSDAQFSKLASQISQPLIHPVPPASACYPVSNPSGNCTAVQEGWGDGNWRSDQSGSMQAPNWETHIFSNKSISACYLNTTLGLPCEQGSVPVVGVDARSPEDIQAAVKFAAAHDLRVVVKSTGHDFFGRSTARGSFLIWTHHLKNITVHDTFIPQGAPNADVYEKAMTLGAGVQWHEAYDAAHAANRVIVGGLSVGGSVGAAGGWLLGGGHSALAPSYGLGVDNVIQFTVVTSKGEHLTANAYQHSDLFWALRGGGGGTYGVTTSVTYRTRPDPPIAAAFFAASINSTTGDASSPILKKLFTEWIRYTPVMSDAGWGGYTLFGPVGANTSDAIEFFVIAPNVSSAQANHTLQPFFDIAQSLAANSSVENGGKLTIMAAFTTPFNSFHDWETSIFRSGSGQVGGNAELGSRLFTRELIEQKPGEIAETLLPLTGLTYYLVAGGAVSHVEPSSTGLNPAWRKALVHTTFGTGWQEGATFDEIQAARATVKEGIANLHKLEPNSGAYFNEGSLYEPDPAYTFFGSHYDKLKTIKLKYDPLQLFVVPKGVGSELWDDALLCQRA